MTDREKLYAITAVFALPLEETGRTMIFSGRRFSFNADGEIMKIIDLKTRERYTAEAEE